MVIIIIITYKVTVACSEDLLYSSETFLSLLSLLHRKKRWVLGMVSSAKKIVAILSAWGRQEPHIEREVFASKTDVLFISQP